MSVLPATRRRMTCGVDQGQLTATSGASVDYEFVAAYLADLSTRCDLREVRFDRWRINDLERALEKIGANIPLAPHGQGFRDMSPALEQLESLALNGQLRHGNHPILTWNAANAIVVSDAAGNRKLDRSRATGRCLTSAPTEQIEGFAERRISGSSQ